MDAAHRRTTHVVVRAFNEAATLGDVLHELLASGYPVVVVDDGSSDDTPSIARSLPVRLVRHRINLGPGAALQTGLAAALADGAERIVSFDADGQHQVGDIDRLVEPIVAGRADAVFGSRFLRAEDRRRVPLPRRILLRGAVVVNALFAGRWLSDAHNGLRALSAEVARGLELEESSFAYASELLARLVERRWRLVEVPVTVLYTESSLAKGQKGWNAINVVIDLLGGRSQR
jgi:glycosyltransferase involved in cell wall biosynthesis